MSDLKNRWFDLTSHFLTDETAEIVWDLLDAHYSEAGRAYHNWNHISDCFVQLDQVSEQVNQRLHFELAIFYHDVIYIPRAADNEQASADFAAETLSRAGFPDSEIAIVSQLIMDTTHQQKPQSADGQLLVDIDLSILGAEPARFAQYDAQVREEYSWVEEQAYKIGRSRIMQSFLDRERIYYTAYFAENYEAQARINLRDLIERLKG
ncbi:MAG: N-methyl-D-aspartate receptor NMDAR2C subunit [Chloroflexota bacterium]